MANLPIARGSTVIRSPMLSDEEILRRLRAIKHSSETSRRRGLSQSVRAICNAAGIARGRLYQLANGTVGIGPVTRARLSQALTGSAIDVKETVSVPPLIRPLPGSVAKLWRERKPARR